MGAYQSVIQTERLSKYYGTSRGVIDIDLDIGEGEIFGFLGPNGAGKTTTIRLLLGMLRPTDGTLTIFDRDLGRHRKEILSAVGYLPGDLGLYGELSGMEFLQHLLKVRRLFAQNDIRKRTADLIDRFGIDLNGKIRTYSKGMRQIVGIIQAFCHAPRLLILDEPSTGLDPVMQETFYHIIFEEKERGATLFFSSHILREVERVCDRAGIIREGRLVSIENLETYRSLGGKKVTLRCAENIQAAGARISERLAPESLVVQGDRISFFSAGAVRDLLTVLNTIAISDLIIEPPTLEDYFLSYYREDGEHDTE
jgi:ABC-2 type transport system ATP-binding protein